MEIKIYTLEDPDSGEIRYVGQTCKSLRDRLYNHLWDAKNRNRNYRNNWILNILEKGKKPIIKILDICDKQNLIETEKYWIAQMRAWGFRLVNLTDGGEGTPGIKWDNDRKDNHSQSIRNTLPQVYQYDLKGNFLNGWDNIPEAAECLDLRGGNISQVCTLNKKSHGGFIWSYDSPDEFDFSKYKHKKRTKFTSPNNNFVKQSKKVLAINKKTKKKLVFNSINEASKKLGVNVTSIIEECKERRKNRSNYNFRYYEWKSKP